MITCIKRAYWRGEVSLENKHFHSSSRLFTAGGRRRWMVSWVGGQTAWWTQRLENIDPTRPFLCNPKLEWVCAQYSRGTMTMTHCRISFLFTCQVFPVIYLLWLPHHPPCDIICLLMSCVGEWVAAEKCKMSWRIQLINMAAHNSSLNACCISFHRLHKLFFARIRN